VISALDSDQHSDYRNNQRVVALADAAGHVQRACAALLASKAGESDLSRASILLDACRKLNAVLRELQALA
jgi:hypothetical protein